MSRRARFSSEGGAGQQDIEGGTTEVEQGDGDQWAFSSLVTSDRTRSPVSGEPGIGLRTGEGQEEAQRGGGVVEGEEALSVMRRALLVGGVALSPECRVREGRSLVVGFLITLNKVVNSRGKEGHGTQSVSERFLHACPQGVGQPAQGSADQWRRRHVGDDGPHLRDFSQLNANGERRNFGEEEETSASGLHFEEEVSTPHPETFDRGSGIFEKRTNQQTALPIQKKFYVSYNARAEEVVPWKQKENGSRIEHKRQLDMPKIGGPMGGSLFAEGVRIDGFESVALALTGLVLAVGLMLTGRGRGGSFLGTQRRAAARRGQLRERLDDLEAGVGVRQAGETDWKQDTARASEAEPVVRTAARFLGDYMTESWDSRYYEGMVGQKEIGSVRATQRDRTQELCHHGTHDSFKKSVSWGTIRIMLTCHDDKMPETDETGGGGTMHTQRVRSWRSIKRMERWRRLRSRSFRLHRSRDEFVERFARTCKADELCHHQRGDIHTGSQSNKSSTANLGRPTGGCWVQWMMMMTVYAAIHKTTCPRECLGKGKNDDDATTAARRNNPSTGPPRMPNIDGNCYFSAAVHMASEARGYNAATRSNLWENQHTYTGSNVTVTTSEMRAWLDRVQEDVTDFQTTRGDAPGMLDRILRNLEDWPLVQYTTHNSCQCGMKEEHTRESATLQCDFKLVREGYTLGCTSGWCKACGKWQRQERFTIHSQGGVIYTMPMSDMTEAPDLLQMQVGDIAETFQLTAYLTWRGPTDGGAHGHFVAWKRVGSRWWKCDDDTVLESERDKEDLQNYKVIGAAYRQVRREGHNCHAELIPWRQAAAEIRTWLVSPSSGPRTQSFDGKWTALDHWKRANRAHGRAPARIKELLDTWPELDIDVWTEAQLDHTAARSLKSAHVERSDETLESISVAVSEPTIGEQMMVKQTAHHFRQNLQSQIIKEDDICNYNMAREKGWSLEMPSMNTDIQVKELEAIGDGPLGEEVINALLAHVANKDSKDGCLMSSPAGRVWVANTYYYARLFQGDGLDVETARQWSGGFPNVLELEYIILPIHQPYSSKSSAKLGKHRQSTHWMAVIFDMRKEHMQIMDSWEAGNLSRQMRLNENAWAWFELLHQERSLPVPDFGKWVSVNPPCSTPQQHNNIDCGVYVILFITFKVRGWSLELGRQDVAAARTWILQHLLKSGSWMQRETCAKCGTTHITYPLTTGSISPHRCDKMEEREVEPQLVEAMDMETRVGPDHREAGASIKTETYCQNSTVLLDASELNNYPPKRSPGNKTLTEASALARHKNHPKVLGNSETKRLADGSVECTDCISAQGELADDRDPRSIAVHHDETSHKQWAREKMVQIDIEEFCKTRCHRDGILGRTWQLRMCRGKGSRDQMLNNMPDNAFPVAVDNAFGSKEFTFFDSAEEFFRDTAWQGQKNFYEIFLPGRKCKAYFDIEHYTETDKDPSRIEEVIGMIQETMCQLWGTQEQEVHRACKEYVLLTASRQDIKSGKFKHSYHLIFPQIHLECNSGRLKQLAQKLSKHEGLQARGKNGERLGMIDSKVYSRYQNYRLVESCKKATTWSGVEAAGVLRDPSGKRMSMSDLMRSLATQVQGPGALVTELSTQSDENVDTSTQRKRNMLHSAGIDSLTVIGEKAYSWAQLACACTDSTHGADNGEYSFKFDQQSQNWALQCEVKDCKGRALLGKESQTMGDEARTWASSAWAPTRGAKDLVEKHFPGLRQKKCDSAEHWADFMEIQVISARAAWYLGWDIEFTNSGSPNTKNALLTPMKAGRIFNDANVEERDNLRQVLLNYKTVWILYQHPEFGQWILIRIEWQVKKFWFYVAERSIPRHTREVIVQWIWGQKEDPQDWESWHCPTPAFSDPSNEGLILWSFLWVQPGGRLPTGEMIPQIVMAAQEIKQASPAGSETGAFLNSLALLGAKPIWEQTSELARQEPIRLKQKKVSKKGNSISDIRDHLQYVEKSEILHQDEEIPVSICDAHEDWQKTSTPLSRKAWCAVAPIRSGRSRVVSQNLGPVGARNSAGLIQGIIVRNNPAVILLQDCRVQSHAKQEVASEFRKRWPQYKVFIASSDRCSRRCDERGKKVRRYHFSVITMVHKSCGESHMTHNAGKQDYRSTGYDPGRILTVQIDDTRGRSRVCTNVYNHTAAEGDQQQKLLTEIGRRIEHTSRTKTVHILGGDWNASLFPEERRPGQHDKLIRAADDRLKDFVQHPSRSAGWWQGQIAEGLLTRQCPLQGQQSRLDEILVHSGESTKKSSRAGEHGSQQYELRTAHTGFDAYDHGTVIADISSKIIQQPEYRGKTTLHMAVDKKTWESESPAWSLRVEKEGTQGEAQSDNFEELQRWIKIARSELCRRSIRQGASAGLGRKPYQSKDQSLLSRQVRCLESELLRADSSGVENPEIPRCMQQISNWKIKDTIPDVTSIDCPDKWTPETRVSWIASVRKGIKERKTHLRRIRQTQNKENISTLKQKMRERMDRPREKEIAHLLNKRSSEKAAETRKSRRQTKQHLDSLHGCMARDKWRRWFQEAGFADPCLLDIAWAKHDIGEGDKDPTIYNKGDMTMELTPGGGRNLKVRIRPLHLFTRFLQHCPPLETGEFVNAYAAEANPLHHCTDALAQDECFFTTNALPNRVLCPNCQQEGMPGKDIAPMSWGSEGGAERSFRYFCHNCKLLSKEVEEVPLNQCPIPDSIFTDRLLPHDAPVLATEIEWEEFDSWINNMPKGKSAGPDEITYEMWQEAPKQMRILLWKAINEINSGRRIPAEWDGAYTKLLVKKAGEEAQMESLRPVCLMNTAVKALTGLWAYRLSRALEAHGVLENVQEGFRPDHSTKRQVTRLLSCIKDAERREAKLIVAFLDFENYFNAISIEALFTLLTRFGMAPQDIQLLRGYYSRAYMTVVQEDGNTTAKIQLRRGLRQGCPLSPILGGVVINALIRWLESLGGGYKHSSGEEYNTLLFADDATLLTEETNQMQVLMDCVSSFSTWTGVAVNLRKSEISGYNFKTRQAIWVGGLRIQGGCPEYLKPNAPFKYLGIRVSIMGSLQHEKRYVREATLRLLRMLAHHKYHPQQIHWVVQVAIIPIFRYSAALAGWTDQEIQDLEKLWIRAYKNAWKVSNTVPGITFWAPKRVGGLAVTPAKAIITQEVIRLMQQCAALHDDLRQITKYDLNRAVLEIGCTSLIEACNEHRWEGTRWKGGDSLCQRFITSISRSMIVAWEDMIAESPETEEGGTDHATEAPLIHDTGIMTLMPREANKDVAPSTWNKSRQLLRALPSHGICTLEQALMHNGCIQLPHRLRENYNGEEIQLTTTILKERGIRLDWINQTQPVRPATGAAIRPGMTGKELIGGTLQLGNKDSWKEGTIMDFNDDRYAVRLCDGSNIKMTLQQVQKSWCCNATSQRIGWTREDQLSLQSIIGKILGERTVDTNRQLCTPFPSRTEDDTWKKTETWYTCTVTAPSVVGILVIFGQGGREADRLAAHTMVEAKMVFWAPRNTWRGRTGQVWHAQGACKDGWWVRAEKVTESQGQIFLEIKSLHREESHRHGEIPVSNGGRRGPEEPLCLRQILRQQSPRMAVFTKAELGGTPEGGFVRSDVLTAFLAANHSLLPLPQVQSPPIIRQPRKTANDLPVIHFELDTEASERVKHRWPKDEAEVIVLKAGGQAHRVCDQIQPRRRPRRTLKGYGAKSRSQTEQSIDWTRWELLKHWFSKEQVIHQWEAHWTRTTAWEAQGGRTLHWAVTSGLRENKKLTSIVRAQALTVDPSFWEYWAPESTPDFEGHERALIPIYEMSEQEKALWMQACKHENFHWIIIARKQDLTKEQLDILNRRGRCIWTIKRGDAFCMRKGWWQTGERKRIRAQQEFQIWERSKSTVSSNPESRTGNEEEEGEDQWLTAGKETWQPREDKHAPALEIFLQALPSGKYRNAKATVAATDGALRLHRQSGEGETMGAGIAWLGEPKREHDSKRVAGPLSSTRAELAAIAQALDLAPGDKDLVLLVDSAAALNRLKWFKKPEFRPIPHKIKDLDIVDTIVRAIHEREQKGLHLTLVKVHGHTGEPLHALADELATAGADRPLREEEQPLFPVPNATTMVFQLQQQDKPSTARIQWSPKVRNHIREHESQKTWERRKRGTWAEKFHSATEAGRQILGAALQQTWDWAVSGWIRSLTPHAYPVAKSFAKMNHGHSDRCRCGKESETFLHLQLRCELPERKQARQHAHDTMLKRLEEGIMESLPETTMAIWNSKAANLCDKLQRVVDKEAMIRKWKKGKPSMHTSNPQEFDSWHRVMRIIWRKQLDRKRKYRTPSRGKEGEEQPDIKRRRLEAVARQTSGQPARRAMEDSNQEHPKWAQRDVDDEVRNRKPDGLLLDSKNGTIFIIEGARTGDTSDLLRRTEKKKQHHYRPLRKALREQYPTYAVKQLNFIMGVQGTIDEIGWRRNLDMLGLPATKQDKIIKRCMVASIEGMQSVLSTKWDTEH